MELRATSKARRPWWRLHVTTLFALAVVGSALGYCESEPQAGPGIFAVNQITTDVFSDYGWPLRCLNEVASWHSVRITDARWRSDVPAALFDVAASVLML